MSSKRFKKLPEKTQELPSEVIEKLLPIVIVHTYNKKNANNIVIGKPKENKFNVGADLVTIPITTFNSVMPTTTGNIIKAPNLNINPPASIPNSIILILILVAPIGRTL